MYSLTSRMENTTFGGYVYDNKMHFMYHMNKRDSSAEQRSEKRIGQWRARMSTIKCELRNVSVKRVKYSEKETAVIAVLRRYLPISDA